MSYESRLHKYINDYGFIRSFLGKCPDCGKEVFSVNETLDPEYTKIKAWFICNCGKKWKEVVYPYTYTDGVKTYKYPQALSEVVDTKKWGKQKMLKVFDGTNGTYTDYLVLPDSVKRRKAK